LDLKHAETLLNGILPSSGPQFGHTRLAYVVFEEAENLFKVANVNVSMEPGGYLGMIGMFRLARELQKTFPERSIPLGDLYDTFGSKNGQLALASALDLEFIDLDWLKVVAPFARVEEVAMELAQHTPYYSGSEGLMKFLNLMDRYPGGTKHHIWWKVFAGREGSNVIELLTGRHLTHALEWPTLRTVRLLNADDIVAPITAEPPMSSWEAYHQMAKLWLEARRRGNMKIADLFESALILIGKVDIPWEERSLFASVIPAICEGLGLIDPALDPAPFIDRMWEHIRATREPNEDEVVRFHSQLTTGRTILRKQLPEDEPILRRAYRSIVTGMIFGARDACLAYHESSWPEQVPAQGAEGGELEAHGIWNETAFVHGGLMLMATSFHESMPPPYSPEQIYKLLGRLREEISFKSPRVQGNASRKDALTAFFNSIDIISQRQKVFPDVSANSESPLGVNFERVSLQYGPRKEGLKASFHFYLKDPSPRVIIFLFRSHSNQSDELFGKIEIGEIRTVKAAGDLIRLQFSELKANSSHMNPWWTKTIFFVFSSHFRSRPKIDVYREFFRRFLQSWYKHLVAIAPTERHQRNQLDIAA
jgi:hypothetical protein